MSRLGKKPIIIPEKTTVTMDGGIISVKGPLGEIKRDFKPRISIKIENNTITLTPNDPTHETNALWGTYASHLKNMIQGVNKFFSKKLLIEGIGFKVEVKGNEMTFNLGFSHQVKKSIPANLKVTAEKGTITISGADCDAVGQFAAEIRDLKKPEPYKGKGIRYEGEVIRMKQGKKAT
jgi:large subunit ribosomal protein L6